MERIFDLISKESNDWLNKVAEQTQETSGEDVRAYNALVELSAISSKSYEELHTAKNLKEIIHNKKILDLAVTYYRAYPYDAFIKMSTINDLCKNLNYSFSSISDYTGPLARVLVDYVLKKRESLHEDHAVFYVVDKTNKESGWFTRELMMSHGYDDEKRYSSRKADAWIVAPTKQVQASKWISNVTPKAKGCAVLLRVDNGYLMIAAF